jgi:hypothetical protein
VLTERIKGIFPDIGVLRRIPEPGEAKENHDKETGEIK